MKPPEEIKQLKAEVKQQKEIIRQLKDLVASLEKKLLPGGNKI